MSGIYYIKNITTSNLYIGSSINIERRIKDHYNKLRNNKHVNKYMQASYNKYKPESFIWGVAEYCKPEREVLETVEQSHINKYDFKILFNLNKIAVSNSYNKSNFDKKRVIYQYDINGNFIKEWDSCLAACLKYGNGVRSCLNNSLIACKKYFFFYKTGFSIEKLTYKIKKYNSYKNKRKVAKYDLNGTLITIYNNITECSKTEDPGCLKNISRVCLGNRNSFKGFNYKYI